MVKVTTRTSGRKGGSVTHRSLRRCQVYKYTFCTHTDPITATPHICGPQKATRCYPEKITVPLFHLGWRAPRISIAEDLGRCYFDILFSSPFHHDVYIVLSFKLFLSESCHVKRRILTYMKLHARNASMHATNIRTLWGKKNCNAFQPNPIFYRTPQEGSLSWLR